MRLKPAGHRLIIRLSTDVTGDGHEFNFNEIKKGPSRDPPGWRFQGYMRIGNTGVYTLNTYKIMHKIVRKNE